MKWPFDLKYLSKILFQLTRPPEDWTFPSSWMHTTIWSNHSQCISLYIYKTLRSFWDLNNLDFCTVSTLTCHDENSFLKKKVSWRNSLGHKSHPPFSKETMTKSSIVFIRLYNFPNYKLGQIKRYILIFKIWVSYVNVATLTQICTFWSQCFQSIIAIAQVMGRGFSCPWCPKKIPNSRLLVFR